MIVLTLHTRVTGEQFFLSADRTRPCHAERVGRGELVSVCDTVWAIDNKPIDPSEFAFDPLLGEAKASFMLRGRPITIAWRGEG